MWNFRYYAHCIELNCNFTIWLEVTVNSPFRRINLGSTPVTGGVTQTNKADKRSQRQAVTALYYYHTPPRPVPTLRKPHYPLLCTTTLASLVKGRWIDGKPQTVALLRFACDTSAFLIYQTFCRQDGGIACYKLFQPCRHLR